MLLTRLCGVLNRIKLGGSGNLPNLRQLPPRLPVVKPHRVSRSRRVLVAFGFHRPSAAGGRHDFEIQASGDLTLQPLIGSHLSSDLEGRVVSRHEASKVAHEAGQSSPPPPRQSWQYLVFLCSVGIVICYADRSNISTAILPMAAQFGWDRAFQGIVLSSFFAGYACTQIIGGNLADKLGGKMILAAGVALWSIFTFLTPMAAAAGTATLISCRILLGVGEGVAFPAVHSLIARRVPVASQSTAVGLVTAASYVGTALAFGISPHLIEAFDWQTVFYIFGGSALLWLPFWLPIQDDAAPGRGRSAGGKLAAAAPSSGPGSVPVPEAFLSPAFLALLKRKEVWAICLTQYCQSWGMYGLLTWLPTFFADRYHVQLGDLGAYTLLPYIVQGAVGMASGVLADRMISSGFGVRRTRVILQVVGMLGPAACLVAAASPLVAASPEMASALVTIGLGMSALTLGGVSASQLDIAPRHAGVVFGAGNTAATLAGFLSAPITGLLLQSTGSWLLVFSVTAVHYVLGAIFFAAWAGDEQLPEDMEDAGPAPNAAPTP